MSENDIFDAIVVGAGPAGIAAAYVLAREGRQVLLAERGASPGSKNVTGGRLYTYALDLVEPGLWREAALERRVARERIMLLDDRRAINIDYVDPDFLPEGAAAQSYTILRAVFDEWFAGQAEAQGAMLASGIKVDGLIIENDRVCGVRAGEDELRARMVIAADGVNSMLAREAGLVGELDPHVTGVGVKEVIELPEEAINQRFNTRAGEGVAAMLLGCTAGIHGGGFLYTNQESVSLGCVFSPEEAARQERSIHAIFQDLKMHPALQPLLEGGSTAEYSAHLVSEGGWRKVPRRLCRDGLLVAGDAAGFVINTGYSIRGIDLAICSGVAAARAVLAEAEGEAAGRRYMQELHEVSLVSSMKAVDGYYDLLENPRLYRNYPGAALDAMGALFKMNGAPPRSLKTEIRSALKHNRISLWQLVQDGIRGVRSV